MGAVIDEQALRTGGGLPKAMIMDFPEHDLEKKKDDYTLVVKENCPRGIKDLPLTERPREKALAEGVERLTSAELLGLIIGSGRQGENAVDIANRLLTRFGDFRQLASCTVRQLCAMRGIGPARAVEIKACLEIARRFGQIDLVPGEPLKGSQQVFAHFHERLRHEKKEKFFSVLLDVKNRIIRTDLVSVGSLNLSIVHPREVFGPALRESAVHILFIHNHPSGDPTPSQEDILVTQRLVAVGHVVGVEVLDHIVIGDGRYTSFAEQKLL